VCSAWILPHQNARTKDFWKYHLPITLAVVIISEKEIRGIKIGKEK
jgi:hypothetical protein